VCYVLVSEFVVIEAFVVNDEVELLFDIVGGGAGAHFFTCGIEFVLSW
jgi:hypothetical protein